MFAIGLFKIITYLYRTILKELMECTFFLHKEPLNTQVSISLNYELNR